MERSPSLPYLASPIMTKAAVASGFRFMYMPSFSFVELLRGGVSKQYMPNKSDKHGAGAGATITRFPGSGLCDYCVTTFRVTPGKAISDSV